VGWILMCLVGSQYGSCRCANSKARVAHINASCSDVSGSYRSDISIGPRGGEIRKVKT